MICVKRDKVISAWSHFTGLAPSGVDKLRTVCPFYIYVLKQHHQATVSCLLVMLKALGRRKVTHLWFKSVYNPTEKLENEITTTKSDNIAATDKAKRK